MVGADEQAVSLDVVTGVDDDGQLGPDERLDAVGQLGATDAARQDGDGHVPGPEPATRSSASRTSPIRARVSVSYGAGRRAMTVAKPSCR